MAKVQTKIILLLCAVMAVFLAAFLAQFHYEQGRSKALFESRENDERMVLEKLLTLKGKSLENFVDDYTFWDEMVAFIRAGGEKQWAQENLHTAAWTFKASNVWIYSTDLTPAYVVNNSPDAALQEIPVPRESVSGLFSESPLVHFFHLTPQGLLEIRGATVHSTSDPSRVTPRAGYFFAGRLWSEAHLAELSELAAADVKVLPAADLVPASTPGERALGVITFSRALAGWDGKLVARLWVRKESSILRDLNRASTAQLALLVSFMLGVLALLFFSLLRWVSRPLGALSRSLHAAEPSALTPVAGDRTEFGDLARAIRRFFEQKASLEREVLERKRAEDLLRAAKAEAERANSAKSQFLSSMSHELRTPLNSILGFAQLLASDSRDSLTLSQRENVEHIVNSGRHLLSLINEVLDLARIEAGRLTISPESVCVGPVLVEVLETLEPSAAQRAVRVVDLTGDFHDSYVRADRNRLRQVLLNLVSNAIKYNREEGVVTLGCERLASNRLRFTVTDTGLGIPESEQAGIFEPFNRLAAEQSGIEGSGMGLAISKRLMELMGGTIGLARSTRQGSTFYIELPAAADPVEAEPVEEAMVSRPNVRPTRSRRTLLYVEDNPDNLKLVSRILARRPQIELLAAGDAATGLALARLRAPDLILMDIDLPGIDGYEALRRLQGSAETRAIPVLAVSANAMPLDVARGLEAGFLHYITKPIDVFGFLEILDEVLEAAVARGGNEDSQVRP